MKARNEFDSRSWPLTINVDYMLINQLRKKLLLFTKEERRSHILMSLSFKTRPQLETQIVDLLEDQRSMSIAVGFIFGIFIAIIYSLI